jgi:hypothetical protein
MKLWREVCAGAVGLAFAVSCSKSEPGGAAAPASASAAAAPPATVAASATPVDSAAETPVKEAAPVASGGKTQPASAAGSAAAGPKTFACGNKGQPTCPTQSWMKANMGPAAASGDGPDLAKGLDYIAAHAPAGMPNWSGIAKGGAAKARAADIDGAKASCKSCHDQYKAKYKAEVRDRPF